MRFAVSASLALCLLARASSAVADERVLPPIGGRSLLDAGTVAIADMTAAPGRAVRNLQMRPSQIKTDRTTIIIIVSIAAVVSVVWFEYQLRHQ